VEAPLSADRIVWPSLFDLAGAPDAPAWTGANALVWDDLDGLRRFVAARWPQPVPSHAIVAVTWVSDREFADAGATGPYREPTTPPTVSPAWPLLGFDVGDGSLLSGLMNCGYAADEVEALRARWAARLNEHHLFTSIEDALAFRGVSDARVREHAPFFGYGLYLVAGAV
jgi:hypothetical protein